MILSWEVWANKTDLNPPLFIEVTVTNHESRQTCICTLHLHNCSDDLVFFYFSSFYSSDNTTYLFT